jgi:hypothetical protein
MFFPQLPSHKLFQGTKAGIQIRANISMIPIGNGPDSSASLRVKRTVLCTEIVKVSLKDQRTTGHWTPELCLQWLDKILDGGERASESLTNKYFVLRSNTWNLEVVVEVVVRRRERE